MKQGFASGLRRAKWAKPLWVSALAYVTGGKSKLFLGFYVTKQNNNNIPNVNEYRKLHNWFKQ